jgi:hypothetical protein
MSLQHGFPPSLTDRPSRALTSSTQICIARSPDLPMAASPPVGAIPKPIVIGSAAPGAVAQERTAIGGARIRAYRPTTCI